jgi:hypothetical protein
MLEMYKKLLLLLENGQTTAHKASLEAVLNKEIVAGLLPWDSQRGGSDQLNHV